MVILIVSFIVVFIINVSNDISDILPNKKALEAFGILLQKLHRDGALESPIKIFPRCVVINGRESISPGRTLIEYLKSQTSSTEFGITLETKWE